MNDVSKIDNSLKITITNPDRIKPHHTHRDKVVYIWSFTSTIGYHGKNGQKCYKILVVIKKNIIITAFPIL